MYYYNKITEEYPRYTGDLELLGWVQGEPFPDGWVEVTDTDRPLCESDETVEIANPVQDSEGIWKAAWTTRKLTDEEKQSNRVALIRLKVSNGQSLTADEAALLVAD